MRKFVGDLSELVRFCVQASLAFGFIGLLILAILYAGLLVVLIGADAVLFDEPKLSVPAMDAGIAVLDWLGDVLFFWVP